MPATLPIPQQILAEPVTNYYKGKALRVNQALAEKELEQADAKLEVNKRQVAAEEKRADIMEDQLNQRIAEYTDQVGRERAAKEADQIIGITAGAKNIIDGGGTPEDSIAYANEQMAAFVDSLPDGENKEQLRKMAEDGFQPEELAQLHAAALATKGYVAQRGSSDERTQIERMIDELDISDDEKAALRKKWVEKQVSEKSASVDETKPLPTPTRAEEEIIEANIDEVIKNSPAIDEYGMSDTNKMRLRGWVSDEAERIQRFYAKRNKEIGFNEAAEIAADDASKFIAAPTDPGFFRHDSAEFSPPLYRRGDVIPAEQTEDGKPWIVTGYGPNGEVLGEPANSN